MSKSYASASKAFIDPGIFAHHKGWNMADFGRGRIKRVFCFYARLRNWCSIAPIGLSAAFVHPTAGAFAP